MYGLDLISSTDGSGVQTYFTYDGLGSTTDLTNASATVTGTYSYDVFGAIRSQSGGSGNYWQFTGEQRDAAENLYYLRARYYDPTSARFLGNDPLRGSLLNPQSQNLYAYVGNNPINRVDPSGLRWMDDGGGSGRKYEGGMDPTPGPGPYPGQPTPCPTPTPTPNPTPGPWIPAPWPTPVPPPPTPTPTATPCGWEHCYYGCLRELATFLCYLAASRTGDWDTCADRCATKCDIKCPASLR